VHCVQEDEAARADSAGGGCDVKGFRDRSRSDCEPILVVVEEAPAESLGPKRTIVLLVKHVHLQNVGTAREIKVLDCGWRDALSQWVGKSAYLLLLRRR
jgi:hypothetical protein